MRTSDSGVPPLHRPRCTRPGLVLAAPGICRVTRSRRSTPRATVVSRRPLTLHDMVYALILHALEAECPHVLLSFFFTPEGNDGHRKRREAAVADMVSMDYRFRRECDAFSDGLPSGAAALDDAWHSHNVSGGMTDTTTEEYTGVFTLPASPFIAEPMVTLWRRCGSIAYTLVLEQHENRLLAVNFLTLFESSLREHFKVGKNISNWDHKAVALRPEEVASLVNHHIPSGRLLFSTPALANHFRKEASEKMA